MIFEIFSELDDCYRWRQIAPDEPYAMESEYPFDSWLDALADCAQCLRRFT